MDALLLFSYYIRNIGKGGGNIFVFYVWIKVNEETIRFPTF